LYKLASFSASSAVNALEGGMGLPPRLTLPPSAPLLPLASSAAIAAPDALCTAGLWRLGLLLNNPVLCIGCVLLLLCGEDQGAALGDALGCGEDKVPKCPGLGLATAAAAAAVAAQGEEGSMMPSLLLVLSRIWRRANEGKLHTRSRSCRK
jgi:hypothetical protein